MNIRNFRGFVSESISDDSSQSLRQSYPWNLSDRGLTKEISFETQTDLVEFLLKVARLADKNKHHPDVEIYEVSKLRLKLFTHSEGAITDLDRILAKFIDYLLWYKFT